jgi:hypothetical protein
MSTLKTRLKTTWESGDYGVFAKYLEKGALEFFGRLNIPAGTRLLDVACGVESKAFGIRCSWWVPACARSELWMSMAEPRDGGLRPCGGLIRLLNPRQYRRTSLTKA